MKVSRFFALTLFAVVAAAATVALGERASGGEGERGALNLAPKVGTVDIQDVIFSFLQKSGAQDQMENTYATMKKTLEQLSIVITEMEQESQVYPRDSEKYLEVAADISNRKNQYRTEREKIDHLRQLEAGKLTKETYAKARKVIETVAKERDLDVVFMVNQGSLGGSLMDEVSSGIVTRTVLYARSELDITEQVKSLMGK